MSWGLEGGKQLLPQAAGSGHLTQILPYLPQGPSLWAGEKERSQLSSPHTTMEGQRLVEKVLGNVTTLSQGTGWLGFLEAHCEGKVGGLEEGASMWE